MLGGGENEDYAAFKSIWTGGGYDGELLLDVQRPDASDLLSVLTRASGSVGEGTVLRWISPHQTLLCRF